MPGWPTAATTPAGCTGLRGLAQLRIQPGAGAAFPDKPEGKSMARLEVSFALLNLHGASQYRPQCDFSVQQSFNWSQQGEKTDGWNPIHQPKDVEDPGNENHTLLRKDAHRSADTRTAATTEESPVDLHSFESNRSAFDTDLETFMENMDLRRKAWWIIYPDTTMRRIWLQVTLVIALYIVWVTPIRVGYNMQSQGFFFWMEGLMNLFFLVDLILNFFLAYEHPATSEVITDHKLIAQRYVLSGWFWVDLLATFPSDFIIKALEGTFVCSVFDSCYYVVPQDINFGIIVLLRCMRFFRIIWIIKNFHVISVRTILGKVREKWRSLIWGWLISVFEILIILMIMGAQRLAGFAFFLLNVLAFAPIWQETHQEKQLIEEGLMTTWILDKIGTYELVTLSVVVPETLSVLSINREYSTSKTKMIPLGISTPQSSFLPRVQSTRCGWFVHLTSLCQNPPPSSSLRSIFFLKLAFIDPDRRASSRLDPPESVIPPALIYPRAVLDLPGLAAIRSHFLFPRSHLSSHRLSSILQSRVLDLSHGHSARKISSYTDREVLDIINISPGSVTTPTIAVQMTTPSADLVHPFPVDLLASASEATLFCRRLLDPSHASSLSHLILYGPLIISQSQSSTSGMSTITLCMECAGPHFRCEALHGFTFRYTTATYWAYTTMTTVGYGDICGDTIAEKIW
eukprot:gene12569-15792_t